MNTLQVIQKTILLFLTVILQFTRTASGYKLLLYLGFIWLPGRVNEFFYKAHENRTYDSVPIQAAFYGRNDFSYSANLWFITCEAKYPLYCWR